MASIFDLAYLGKEIPPNSFCCRDYWGNTPLHYAAISPFQGYFQRLISRGANPYILNQLGASPLLMQRLVQKQQGKEIEGYPILDEVYVNSIDIYHWWKEVRPGEKWTFLNLYPSYSEIPRAEAFLRVQGGSLVGRRVFAKQTIEEGALICEYLGEFYPAVFYTQEMEGLFDVPKGLFKKAHRSETEYINGCIDGKTHGNEAALIGDGVPNVEFIPSPSTRGLPLRIVLRALTEIQKGEEITAYYMGHPLRYDPDYVELRSDLRKKRIEAIFAGNIGPAEEWFLRYFFHTPYLLIPLLLKKEISWRECTLLFESLPEEVSWMIIPSERMWEEYLVWMGRALQSFKNIKFPHTRLFFDALKEMSFVFEKRNG